MRPGALVILVLLAAGGIVAFAVFFPGSGPGGKGGMRITSPAFSDGGPIPAKYTVDGADISPPLLIEDVPENAASLAIIMDDPDAPGGTFTHWLIWNIRPAPAGAPGAGLAVSISENVPPTGTVEALGGARQGTNDFGEIGYGGPSPSPGSPHRYRFTAFALDTVLELGAGARREQLEAAMEGHVLAQAVLTGVYRR
jgi:hypothetical protein